MHVVYIEMAKYANLVRRRSRGPTYKNGEHRCSRRRSTGIEGIDGLSCSFRFRVEALRFP